MANKIPLLAPNVTENIRMAAYKGLGQRMITQGKTVDEFEKKLSAKIGLENPVALNSGTSALELAFHLLDLKAGDEVISPVFTFVGATIPLLRRGVKIVFADVKDTMLLDWDDARKRITPKTKAIINVHLFNQESRVEKVNVPIIGDAAQYLAQTKGELFTIYSFQAVKLLTTVDGGVLCCHRQRDYKRAKLLRWYGIDREESNNIETDIFEAGFKYHMNNVTAAMGLAALKDLPKWQAHIRILQDRYHKRLKDVSNIKAIGGSPFLIHTKKRPMLIKALAKKGVEAGLTIRRNDVYTVFGRKRLNFPAMNRLESTYLLLPCRATMSLKEVDYICNIIAGENKR